MTDLELVEKSVHAIILRKVMTDLELTRADFIGLYRIGFKHSCFYMTDGNYLESEIGRDDGIDAYWVNGVRVFKAVWDRYFRGER